MSSANGNDSVEFARISQLPRLWKLPRSLTNDLDEEKYLQLAPLARAELMALYEGKGYDVNQAIATDPNVRATYTGYIRFLVKDLAVSNNEGDISTSSASSVGSDVSIASGTKKGMKKRAAKVAKQMISRGKASLL